MPAATRPRRRRPAAPASSPQPGWSTTKADCHGSNQGHGKDESLSLCRRASSGRRSASASPDSTSPSSEIVDRSATVMVNRTFQQCLCSRYKVNAPARASGRCRAGRPRAAPAAATTTGRPIPPAGRAATPLPVRPSAACARAACGSMAGGATSSGTTNRPWRRAHSPALRRLDHTANGTPSTRPGSSVDAAERGQRSAKRPPRRTRPARQAEAGRMPRPTAGRGRRAAARPSARSRPAKVLATKTM